MDASCSLGRGHPDRLSFEWNLKLADDLHINKAAVEAELKASCDDDEDALCG